jgi:hypothetical protein
MLLQLLLQVAHVRVLEGVLLAWRMSLDVQSCANRVSALLIPLLRAPSQFREQPGVGELVDDEAGL